MLILAICLRPLFRAALPAAARSRIAAMEMADGTRTRSLVSMVSWLDFAVAKKPNKRCIFCAPTRIRLIIITNYVRSELCVSGTFSETLWPTCLVVAYLSRCGETGGVICSTTKADEFRGYDLDQVERAICAALSF